jgi:mRNA export factor
MVVAVGADKKVRLRDLTSGQDMLVGAHEAPIRSVRFIQIPNSAAPVIATGSWDTTVRYWDGRQDGPVASLACKERVYSMDCKDKLLVAATADRDLHVVDLSNPTEILHTQNSRLDHQTRAVAVLLDGTGWATAGIGGKIAIDYFPANKAK